VPRPVDEPIPDNEALYRGLLPEWIKGQAVLLDAVDLEGTSVNRHKYNPDPVAAILASPGNTGVASIVGADFPEPLVRQAGPPYRFRADDLPSDLNEAHAEIRPYRVGKPWDHGHKIAPANRLLLKQGLADKMKLLPFTASPSLSPT
jgi:hypothetical protein